MLINQWECVTYTHLVLNGVLGTEDLREGVSTEGVPEGGLGEKSCGICCIVDELDGGHRVADTKLYYGINIDSHTVFSEDLERKVIHPLYETCNITKKNYFCLLPEL